MASTRVLPTFRPDSYLEPGRSDWRELVDALGGITVNVNERVAMGGISSAHIPPKKWIEPGPRQHLDGRRALWFARGRYGADEHGAFGRDSHDHRQLQW